MYKYNIKNDEWEDTNRPLKKSKGWHSCLLLDKEIFVAGGIVEDYIGTNKTEIFNLQSNTWRSGPDLPREIHSSPLVKAHPSSQYAAFFIGGSPNENYPNYPNSFSDIYALTKDLKSFIRIGELKIARFGHVAMVLPEKLVENCVD